MGPRFPRTPPQKACAVDGRGREEQSLHYCWGRCVLTARLPKFQRWRQLGVQPLGCRDFRLQCGGSGEQLRPGVSSSHPSQVCTELSILLLLYPSSGQGMDEGMKERQRSSSRWIFSCGHEQWGFLRSSVSKESACTAGDLGLIPGLGRSPGEGNGNPLQYACLKNPMDRGAW